MEAGSSNKGFVRVVKYKTYMQIHFVLVVGLQCTFFIWMYTCHTTTNGKIVSEYTCKQYIANDRGFNFLFHKKKKKNSQQGQYMYNMCLIKKKKILFAKFPLVWRNGSNKGTSISILKHN